MTTFIKQLSANDIGSTGSHQAGILVPKGDPELVGFFGKLDPSHLNPDAWISCVDEELKEWRLRFVYYNNKLHTPGGTRNEYRITHLTKYFKSVNAAHGDSLVFTSSSEPRHFSVRLERSIKPEIHTHRRRVVLTGWRKVH
ncbi:EcoRII N-terminal effector-binding domain-containing protein [Stenotrophomonas nitritireducens]|uniref:EcoRII N-terminal effector-binding domain-containing protein n=1 Tax=Stenotrophomonas nitritireducens TaxID=83617 RepID=UPI0009E9677D